MSLPAALGSTLPPHPSPGFLDEEAEADTDDDRDTDQDLRRTALSRSNQPQTHTHTTGPQGTDTHNQTCPAAQRPGSSLTLEPRPGAWPVCRPAHLRALKAAPIQGLGPQGTPTPRRQLGDHPLPLPLRLLLLHHRRTKDPKAVREKAGQLITREIKSVCKANTPQTTF